MSWTPLLVSLSGYGSAGPAVLPFLGGIAVASIGALSALFVARLTARAPLQESVNSALRLLMEERLAQHARDSALISELQGQIKVKDSEIESLRGEQRQGRQKHQSEDRLHDKQD